VVPDASVRVTLDEVMTGCNKFATKKTICPRCNGTGNSGINPYGEGFGTGYGFVNWNGARRADDHSDPDKKPSCLKCKGAGEFTVFASMFEIPRGVMDGSVLRLGDSSRRHFMIKVNEEKHPFFSRQGNGLYCEKHVDAEILKTGGEVTINYLNNTSLTIIVPPNCNPSDTILRLSNKGLPDLNTKLYGDLYCRLLPI
jgi:DnaJ-class molecular chaperone